MALANELVYKGQLQAGNPAVETAQLTLQLPTTLLQVGTLTPVHVDSLRLL